jgi:hypothetical protein
MSLSVGIVGFPNAGKSTLFNALLGQSVADTAPYAFCTVEPNVGVVEVPDQRLDQIAEVVNPDKKIPAAVKFVDIAGLVKGAHQGEGLGNKFLAHIREVDAICFVLRDFENKDVDLAGSVDPRQDLDNLKSELILKDIETLEKAKFEIERAGERERKDQLRNSIIEKLNQGRMVRNLDLSEDEQELIKDLNLLTEKPYFIVLNLNEDDLTEIDQYIDDYSEWTVIPISAQLEAELAELEKIEREKFMQSLGIKQSGLKRLIKTAYNHLGLISFFTTKSGELRAWTVEEGTRIKQAGNVIHSDFCEYFVKGRVIHWKEFADTGGWDKAADQGEIRLVGRNYLVKDGDVIEFVINK